MCELELPPYRLSHRRLERLTLGVVISILLISASTLAADTFDREASDPRAIELAERTLAAMGGSEAWAATRFLRFNFFGIRLHHWDRYSGRHRYEGKTRDGDAFLVLHNVQTREGKAYVNGELQQGESHDEWLQKAYSAWINDTYWLIMPYKLMDPGVRLQYEGEETFDGKVYDKVLLTFDAVGLTPGDKYWAYLNRDTGLMDRWAYFLQDWEEGRQPTHWWWLGWQSYGDIKLAPRRVNPDPENGRETELSQLAVFDELADAMFTSTAPVALD